MTAASPCDPSSPSGVPARVLSCFHDDPMSPMAFSTCSVLPRPPHYCCCCSRRRLTLGPSPSSRPSPTHTPTVRVIVDHFALQPASATHSQRHQGSKNNVNIERQYVRDSGYLTRKYTGYRRGKGRAPSRRCGVVARPPTDAIPEHCIHEKESRRHLS